MAAFLTAVPFMAAQPAAAEVIYPWCLFDMQGGVNCGFVNQAQCFASKTANADMCGINGLYDRAREYRPRRYAPRRARHRG
jgi:hypothetical protein